MIRNFEEIIRTYEKKYNYNDQANHFDAIDCIRLIEYSGGTHQLYTTDEILVALKNAFEYGFMIGYRTANEEKEGA